MKLQPCLASTQRESGREYLQTNNTHTHAQRTCRACLASTMASRGLAAGSQRA